MKTTFFLLTLFLALSSCRKYEHWQTEQNLSKIAGNWQLNHISTENEAGDLVQAHFFRDGEWRWRFESCDLDSVSFCEGVENQYNTNNELVYSKTFQYRFSADNDFFERNGVTFHLDKLNKSKLRYYFLDSSNMQKTYYEFEKLAE